MDGFITAGGAILVALISAGSSWLLARRTRKETAEDADVKAANERADYILDSYHDMADETMQQITQCREENQRLRDRLNGRTHD